MKDPVEAGNANTISVSGEDIMNPGDRVLVGAKDYQCATTTLANSNSQCESTTQMYKTVELFGAFMCTGEDLSCVLDGEDMRQILYVDGTGASKLDIKGFKFYRGDSVAALQFGGGLDLLEGATVSLEFCSFESCHARTGGAIYVYPASSLTAYGVSFTDNSVEVAGADIGNAGITAIYDSCPPGWVGEPEKGKSDSNLVSSFKTSNSKPLPYRICSKSFRNSNCRNSLFLLHRFVFGLSRRKRRRRRMVRSRICINLYNLRSRHVP